MCSPVVSESGAAGEPPATDRATVGLDGAVDGEVVPQVVLISKGLPADVTSKGLVLDVSFPEVSQTLL